MVISAFVIILSGAAITFAQASADIKNSGELTALAVSQKESGDDSAAYTAETKKRKSLMPKN